MATAWRLVWLLWFVALLNYLDRQVVFSLLPLLRRDLGLSDAQLGLLATSFLWFYAAASLVSGFVAARLGVRRVILLSLLFWSAVTLLTGIVRTPVELIAARALMGLSEAFYLPAGLALVAEFHDDRSRGRATALHQSGIYMGVVLGGALGGWMGEHFGWRPPFIFLGLVGLIYTAFLAWSLPSSAQKRSVSLQSAIRFRSVVAIPGLPAMIAVFALFGMAGWVVMTWMSLYLYERFGMSLVQAGFSSAFFLQAGSFAGIFASGWASDRWSRVNSLARVYLPAVGFVISAVFLFLAGAANEAAVVLAAITAYGLGRGFYDANIMPLLCLTATPEQRAPAYGLFNFVGAFTGGVTALGAGMLKSHIGIDGALRCTAVLLFFATVLLLGPIRQRILAAAFRSVAVGS
ncbi:MFS transporter [Paludibaculum fermentans]|uniref:MFS transporter n=1 Tax=Paludibaculum fermentans TaxID=1473598 RepID=UPI003EB99A0F